MIIIGYYRKIDIQEKRITSMSENPDTPSPFDSKEFLRTVSQLPGVYSMLDAKNEIIYVGKAKNLRKRLNSHFVNRDANSKQRAMIAKVQSIEIAVTRTEGEALLLENQLIKRHRPRYNITLRDDKSYPYIHLSDHAYPRLSFHRGTRNRKGKFFGPYPSASAVRFTLKQLQKMFPVRQCRDSVFQHRTRPCLEYQIGRCSGPCVGLVSSDDYARDVRDSTLFLEGESSLLIEDLVQRMEHASTLLDFESAAVYRDRIAALRTILANQHVSGFEGNIDIIAVSVMEHTACIEIVFIRNGQQIGNQSFFPRLPGNSAPDELLSAFIGQYYLAHSPPKELLLSHALNETEKQLLEEMLSTQSGSAVRITHRVRGDRQRKLEIAQLNAEQSLLSQLASHQTIQQRAASMVEALNLRHPPQRIECFDISHTQGELTVASCVVFGPQGAIRSEYRRFNISGITPGDDYAAMNQALERRYQRIVKGETPAPDLLLIDGGRGQVSATIRALEVLGADPSALGITVIGVAKGPDRKPGMEMLFAVGRKDPIILPAHSPALLLIQQVRDEAHRFAVTGHRQRRAKARQASSLEELAGVGPKRRQQLLRQFGGLREISRADVDALASVEGISRQLAQRIYDFFHDQGR